jgi:lysozyme
MGLSADTKPDEAKRSEEPMRRLSTSLMVSAMAGCLTLAATGCDQSPDLRYDSRGSALQVCAPGPTLPGIDVSYWQGTINWDQVAADGIEFAFIRVSDGTTTYDTEFQRNWSEAKRVGIIRGVYQFFRPSQDPVAQADLLISEIGGSMEPGDLPPVVDVETGSGLSRATVAARLQEWIDRVESVLGVEPIIYTSPGVWGNYVNSSAFGDYPLWVAHYYVSCPTMPTGWDDWEFHQYTDSGHVAGISGGVDRNDFNGDLADLQALTYGDPVCGDGVCSAGEQGSCNQDCPVCEPVPAAGAVIDETDVCFEAGGDPQYWRHESSGWDGELMWTYAVSSQAYNYGVWHLSFEQPGRYLVEAYTASPWAESTQARYQVHHEGVTTVAQVDQTGTDGWTVIGEFDFEQGGEQWIRLEDLTGEPSSADIRVVVDAVRITPVEEGTEPEPELGDPPEEGEPDPDECASLPLFGGIIDEADPCVEIGGDPQWWRSESDGWEGSLLWTHAVSSQVYNYVVWNLDMEVDGLYRIEAYTPADWGESVQARYQIHHQGETSVVEVDQTATDGWTVLGVFELDAGSGQWVRLEDLTGEPNYTNTRVVVDAIRLVRVESGMGSASAGDPSAADSSEGPGRVTSSFGCRAGGRPGSAGSLWFLLLLVGLFLARKVRC